MEWEKAKNIVIILLVALNMVMMGLIQGEKREYTLDATARQTAETVLAEHGLKMAGEWVTYAPPMPELSISLPATDLSSLKEAFFEENETVTTRLGFNQSVLSAPGKTLTVANNGLEYQREASKAPATDRATAETAARAFLRKLSGGEVNVRLDRATAGADGSWTFAFYGLYKGYSLYGCPKEITVSGGEVTAYTATTYRAESFSSEKKAICSADEALLCLAYTLEAEGAGENTVEKLELGYDFREAQEVEGGTTLTMVPCYFIRISGQETAYIINAYTNQLIRS